MITVVALLAVSAPFHVLHYDARLEPDVATRAIVGHVLVRVSIAQATDLVELDRGELIVDAVREGDRPRTFEQPDRKLTIHLSPAAKAGDTREIAIDYHGTPRNGLRFVPERSQMYTVFSTSQ